MDYALVNLVVTIILLVVTVAFRKRILRALGRLLLNGAIEFARGTFLTEEVSKAEDGSDVRKIGLSAQARAIVAAAAPVVLAEALKSIKFKPGAGGPALPPGLNLSDLSSALPAILPMLPKKYQGLVAIAAPFLQNMMGGGGKSPFSGTAKEKNPYE